MQLITISKIDFQSCKVCIAVRRSGGVACSSHMAILHQHKLIRDFEKIIRCKEPCTICHGVQKSKCMICGWRLMTIKELVAFDAEHLRQHPGTTHEFHNRQMARIELHKWMVSLKGKMLIFNMPTTGDPGVDEKIKTYYGAYK